MRGSKTRVVLFVDLDREWAAPLLREELATVEGELRLFRGPLPAALDELGPRLDRVEVLSTFIASPVRGPELERLPGLRLVAARSTGFDHIDVGRARERGVTVCNVPVYGDNTVAEHTFALILSLSRKLRETYERVRRGEFDLERLEGFDLRGRTLGVVGTGHIGLRVIQMARGFSMRVLAHDPREQPLLADVLGFAYRPLDEVLAESDIVTLHAPLTPQTHHLVNARTLQRMKRGALLVNTSRGALVDTDALLAALREGRLAGVGLDVLEQESALIDEDHARAGLHDVETMRTMLLNHLLLQRDNVVFTPHLAFNSREANERIYRTTAANVRAYLAGAPQNVVAG